MKKNKTIWLFLMLVFVLPVAGYALLTWYQQNFKKLPVYGEKRELNGKTEDHRAGNFSFTNQEGKIFDREAWKNKIVVANFFFTHCPSICPKMTLNLKKVQQEYANDDEILINSFTVDPKNDSAAQLKKYGEHYNINSNKWQLLTGDKEDLYRFARNDLMIVATDGDGGPSDFIHSEKLVLLDRQGRARGYYDGTSEKETHQLIHDIKKLKNEN